MTIELIRDQNELRPRFHCPACRGMIVVDLAAYNQDATKPILSNCPYCGAGIFSCVLLMASKDLRQLQKMIGEAVNAVGSSISRHKTIIGGESLSREPS